MIKALIPDLGNNFMINGIRKVFGMIHKNYLKYFYKTFSNLYILNNNENIK